MRPWCYHPLKTFKTDVIFFLAASRAAIISQHANTLAPTTKLQIY